MFLTPAERAAGQIAKRAPKLADRAGKVWAAPNTAIGLAYGALGHAAGTVAHAIDSRLPRPRVRRGENSVDFINNPFGGVGAVTLGNSVTYRGDPYDLDDKFWGGGGPEARRHELQHTIQSQQLGPLYLPSNALGGLTALILDRDRKGQPDWHGDHNWNEQGPMGDPARPWPPRKSP